MRAVLRAISRIVPAALRDDWLREWDAELYWWQQERRRPGRHGPGKARACLRLAGALAHAIWLRTEHWSLDMLLQDLKYAVRMLAGRPSFTLVAALTLALGIGANAAIFSIVYGVLLKPLPFRDPDRLVQIWETNPLRNWTNATASPANLLDWKARNRVFEDIGYYPGMEGQTPMTADLTLAPSNDEPVPLKALQVSANLFDVLGVEPALGRRFRRDEQEPGKHRAVILSHDLWVARFAADRAIVGREVRIDAAAYSVVGVMPNGFVFPSPQIHAWLPFVERPNFPQQRRPHYLRPIARLKPGISIDRARQDIAAIARQLEQEYPDTNTRMGADLGPLHEWIVGDTRRALAVFVAAVGLLLLIACANVANLLLARASGRAREFAIRTAVGAARGRLVRQLLTESLLLAILGGAIGLLVAEWTLRTLIALSPADLPRLHEVRLDRVVVAFMVSITGCVAFLFGLAPAWQSSRVDSGALKEGTRAADGSGRATRRMLVVAQMAASVALVVCAGLLVRSFMRLQHVPPGFDPENVITFRVSLPGVKYDTDRKAIAFYEQLGERLRSIPGVTAAGASTVIGLEGQGWTGDLFIEGRPEVHGRELRHKTIVPGYFATMRLPMVRGRDFTANDDASAPPVVVVNSALARTFFPGEDPVGRRLAFSDPARNPNVRWAAIVGVAGDEKQDGLDTPVAPEVYDTHRQNAEYGMTMVARARTPVDRVLPAIRQELRALEPAIAPYDIRTLEEVVGRSMARQRFTTWLVTAFAALALALAAVGVYGVVAFSVSRRTREIGVRVALGATRGRIVRSVLGEAAALVGAGLALGMAAAALGARGIRSLLFETPPTDLVTYAAVVALLAAVALAAAVVPARRALAVDPIEALRYE
jgi:putative ABC transport system permease protein